MELELSLSPPNQKRHHIKKSCHNNNKNNNNHPWSTASKLPLVSWEHNEDDEQHNSSIFTGDNYHPDLEDDDGEGLSGWPPLHSWRRRLMMEENHDQGENINYVMNNNYNNELFVKVKMDGVGIARKIDLNAFHCYQTLTTALIHMFDKSVENEEDGASYQLMYQHRDGHWHLGGDLPWEMFIRSVKRIQMVRK